MLNNIIINCIVYMVINCELISLLFSMFEKVHFSDTKN